jgi:ATP-dependent RNA helicase DeaD
LAQKYMTEPVLLSLSDDYIGAKEVQHSFYMVSGTGRLADLVRIIDVEDPDSAMIFCNTRDDVQLVAAGLKRHGFQVEWISSDLSQAEREAAMEKMKEGGTRFLVATDVAARGIDISHVTHVINYTFPESLEVYIHRTGRTGRMGRTGMAISLVTPRDIGNLYFLKLTYRINPIERDLPTDGELAARREADLLALLLSEWREPLDEPYLSLANRLMQHVRGVEVVATLLRRALLTDTPEKAKSARRERPGTPVDQKRRSRSRSRKPPAEDNSPRGTVGAGLEEPSGASPVDEEGSESNQESGAPVKEVYVNAGRRDGLRVAEVTRLLEEGGIEKAMIGRIRVRDRSTFVGVRADAAEMAVKALDGQRIKDRVVTAEPAKKARP